MLILQILPLALLTCSAFACNKSDDTDEKVDNFHARMDATFKEASRMLDEKGGGKIKFDTWNEVKSSESKEKQTIEEWEKEGRQSLGERSNERIDQFMNRP